MVNDDSNNERIGWAFVDMNAYYASVEQEINPEYRNKPVGVVATLVDTSCCIAASYEAKALGIKTGTLIAEAKKIFPDIILVEARPKVYVEFHHRILSAIDKCVPITAVLSIDEMACKLYGNEREKERAVKIAQCMKQSIRENVGQTMRCSVGLAPNALLAKMAADIIKPDGLVVIRRCDLPEILYPLEVSDVPGIGKRMQARLAQHGITSMQQLCSSAKNK